MGDLDGRVAIVTGAAGGIGRETSRVLAEAGAKVVLADLPGTDLDGAAAAAGPAESVAAHAVDISDEAAVEGLIGFAVERFGRLDMVDNNAARQGLAGDLGVLTMDPELWDSVFAVNARGTMLMCKHAVPAMAANGGGSIVNIASGTAVAGDDFATAYACTKAAIITLTRYVATQCARQGVRCNAVAPGLIRTPMLEASLPPPVRDVFVGEKLAGRLGEPTDVAELVLFLASERSSFITGQVISIDGGFFAHLPTVTPVRNLLKQMAPPPG